MREGELGPDPGRQALQLPRLTAAGPVRNAHPNGIEGVWPLFKRSMVRAFHWISKKHLDHYMEERELCFNNRSNPHIFRAAVKRTLTTDPLCYREPVAKKAA